MAQTAEERKAIEAAIEERRKVLKITEKKVNGGIIKSVITLENVNEATGAPLTFIKRAENVIELPITVVLGIIKSLADDDNHDRLNRMLKAQCDGYSYDLDLLKEGVKIAKKAPAAPSTGRAK